MYITLIKTWLCLLSLSGYSFVLKKYFNQRFGFSLFSSLIAICCFSYLFSIIFENIYLPVKFFYLLGLLFFALFTGYLIIKSRDKDLLYNTILSPYFLSFLVSSTIIFFIFYPASFFHEWDEFTHWGIVIKEIYTKNRLFRLADLTDGLTSDGGFAYTPMTSISHYFFAKNISPEVFEESTILLANALLLTLPIYFCFDIANQKISGLKKWIVTFVISLILLALYITLILGRKFTIIYVDSCLGLVFGVVCTHAVLYKREGLKNQIFFNSFLFLAIFFLVLIKDFGLLLSLITLPLIWLYNLDRDSLKTGKLKIIKSNTLPTVVALSAIAISRLSWQKVVTGTFFSAQNLSLGKEVNLFALTETQLTIIKNYIVNWASCFYFLEYHVLEVLIAICLIAIATKNLLTAKQKNTMIIILSYMAISYLGYSLCLMYLYLTRFTEYEGLISASYDRYLSTIAYGYILLLFCIILIYIVPAINKLSLSEIYKKIFLGKKSILVFAASVSLIIIIQTGEAVEDKMAAIKRDIITDLKDSPIERVSVRESVQLMLPYLKQGKKVLFLYHNFLFPQCWVVNYEASPYSNASKNAELCMLTQDVYIMNTLLEDKYTKITNAKMVIYNRVTQSVVKLDIIAELKNNYDILFIPKADDQLWRDIGYLFEGNYKNHKFFILNSRKKLTSIDN